MFKGGVKIDMADSYGTASGNSRVDKLGDDITEVTTLMKLCTSIPVKGHLIAYSSARSTDYLTEVSYPCGCEPVRIGPANAIHLVYWVRMRD
jgi:hypothetical protein